MENTFSPSSRPDIVREKRLNNLTPVQESPHPELQTSMQNQQLQGITANTKKDTIEQPAMVYESVQIFDNAANVRNGSTQMNRSFEVAYKSQTSHRKKSNNDLNQYFVCNFFSDKNYGLKNFENDIQLNNYQAGKIKSVTNGHNDISQFASNSEKIENSIMQISIIKDQLQNTRHQSIKEKLQQMNFPPVEILAKLNQEGMKHLNQGKLRPALEYLKTAEKILDEQNEDQFDPDMDLIQMAALTFNNLGCYYKKSEKPNVAYKYLKMALEIEKDQSLDVNIASTKLNICAILSKLQKHKEAIEYAQSAIYDLIRTLKIIKILKLPENKKEEILGRLQVSDHTVKNLNESSKQLMQQTLGIAYYNLAVQYEFINDYERAMQSYSRSKYFANQNKQFSFITQIESNVFEIQKKIKNNKNRLEKKQILKNYSQTRSGVQKSKFTTYKSFFQKSGFGQNSKISDRSSSMNGSVFFEKRIGPSNRKTEHSQESQKSEYKKRDQFLQQSMNLKTGSAPNLQKIGFDKNKKVQLSSQMSSSQYSNLNQSNNIQNEMDKQYIRAKSQQAHKRPKNNQKHLYFDQYTHKNVSTQNYRNFTAVSSERNLNVMMSPGTSKTQSQQFQLNNNSRFDDDISNRKNSNVETKDQEVSNMRVKTISIVDECDDSDEFAPNQSGKKKSQRAPLNLNQKSASNLGQAMNKNATSLEWDIKDKMAQRKKLQSQNGVRTKKKNPSRYEIPNGSPYENKETEYNQMKRDAMQYMMTNTSKRFFPSTSGSNINLIGQVPYSESQQNEQKGVFSNNQGNPLSGTGSPIMSDNPFLENKMIFKDAKIKQAKQKPQKEIQLKGYNGNAANANGSNSDYDSHKQNQLISNYSQSNSKQSRNGRKTAKSGIRTGYTLNSNATSQISIKNLGGVIPMLNSLKVFNGNININIQDFKNMPSDINIKDRKSRLRNLKQYATGTRNKRKFVMPRNLNNQNFKTQPIVSQQISGQEFFAVSKISQDQI